MEAANTRNRRTRTRRVQVGGRREDNGRGDPIGLPEKGNESDEAEGEQVVQPAARECASQKEENVSHTFDA